jgi:CheY-like chemotaxis protein
MNPYQILLVEDNEGDILLTTEALKEVNIDYRLNVVRDGMEAVQFLETSEKSPEAEKPTLIFLDINMPRMGGLEVCSFIKNSELLKHIPVIMLTTSSSQKDILQAYKNGANCYINKPEEFIDFIEKMNQIMAYWTGLVKLPNIEAAAFE